MLLNEAYELMDLLLDKADQPYFTNEEKDKFLDLAISDFVNFHYTNMAVDEESRRAMAPLIQFHSWGFTDSELINGNFIYNSNPDYPALSQKFDDSTAGTTRGYWVSGNQYVLAPEHLYVLNMEIQFYNREELLDSSGNAFSGVQTSDVKRTRFISAKNKSIRDYYQDNFGNDPFNKDHKNKKFGGSMAFLDLDDGLNPQYAYIENRIIIEPRQNISFVRMETITLPDRIRAFSGSTYESSLSPQARVFTDHYQRQIVILAVEKMTQVDVGLMTGPQE